MTLYRALKKHTRNTLEQVVPEIKFGYITQLTSHMLK